MNERIEKFKVWNTSKPKSTAKEKGREEMIEFLMDMHNLTSLGRLYKKKDSLKRDVRGVRVDVREGKRRAEKIFSKWHRDLGGKLYCTDIDMMEYSIRGNEIQIEGVYDTKEWHVTQRKYLQENRGFQAIKKLCEMADIPFYIIWIKLEGVCPECGRNMEKKKTINGEKVWECSRCGKKVFDYEMSTK